MIPIRVIRRRIRSIQNTAKITKAMEMIAASKMRKAQQRALAARPYSEKIREVLSDLAAQGESADIHPLLQRREVKNIAIIHVTPNRGLCGGLNANINRMTLSFRMEQSVSVSLIPVGKKGRDFMSRTGQNILAEFTALGDQPSITDISPIARIVIDDFTNGVVDQVYLAYSNFVTTITQKPTLIELLPIVPAKKEKKEVVDYIFEPSSKEVLEHLLPRYIEMQIYHAVLESNASEQSARMVAMRNATDNAKEIVQDLTLALNKARQEMITKELLDIAGGAALQD